MYSYITYSVNTLYNETVKISNIQPRVALIHDYLTQYGGAERVLEAFCEIYPNAPIYTGICDRKKLTKKLRNKKIITPHSMNKTFLKFPMLSKYFTFTMPLTFEGIDLDEFDIVISNSNSYAKGVLTKPNQLHISYIHTPPRFLYGYSVESTKRNAWYYKPVVEYVDHFLRIWDYCAAQRADYILTNSYETQKRIKKFYGRPSTVIYPPVDMYYSDLTSPTSSYYLAIGRLVAYKNFDFLIEAFNLTGMPLVILGKGPEEKRFKKLAKSNIKFLTTADDLEKQNAFTNSLGIIFPVENEDFGIVPVESKFFGRPVLAHRSGGVLETIREGVDGMFFDNFEIDHFVEKLKEFDTNIRTKVYNPETIKSDTQRFSKDRFKKEVSSFITRKWEEHCAGITRSPNNNL